MGICTSVPQACTLGRLPPRTPGRPDAQVPERADAGPVRYGRLSHFYFFEAGGDGADQGDADQGDWAYGFLDIEIAVQKRGGSDCWLEIYCTGDGFQSATGTGAEHPLLVTLTAGGKDVATARWHYPPVLCGNSDPLSHAVAIKLSAREFETIDGARLWAGQAVSRSCMD